MAEGRCGAGPDGVAGLDGPDGRQVLVVDDDPSVRIVLGRALARCGYEVFLAESGAAALATLDDEPDVFAIVSDLTMPLMSGTELAGEILRRHPGKPILFVTGADADPVLLAHPLIGQVHKPVVIEAVRRALGDLIDLARTTSRTADPPVPAVPESPGLLAGPGPTPVPTPVAALSGLASPPPGG